MRNATPVKENKFKSLTLGVVLAHGNVRSTCERHEAQWLRNCDRLIYLSPTDDNVSLPGRIEYSVGKSAAYSAHTNQRVREALRLASLTHYTYVLLIEYDAVIFDDLDASLYGGEIVAPQFHDVGNPKFKGKFFLHFPQLYSIDAARLMVETMDLKMDLGAELGFSDRFIGLAADLAGLDVYDLNTQRPGYVYTRNEIAPKDLPEAIEAYKKGARYSHGIKTKEVFDALLKASQE